MITAGVTTINQYSFQLLRYVPNIVSGEFVNIGLMGIYLTQVTTRCRIGGNGRLSSESG